MTDTCRNRKIFNPHWVENRGEEMKVLILTLRRTSLCWNSTDYYCVMWGIQQKKTKIIVWQFKYIGLHEILHYHFALFTCWCSDWIDLWGQWQMIALENDESSTGKSIPRVTRHWNVQVMSTAAREGLPEKKNMFPHAILELKTKAATDIMLPRWCILFKCLIYSDSSERTKAWIITSLCRWTCWFMGLHVIHLQLLCIHT